MRLQGRLLARLQSSGSASGISEECVFVNPSLQKRGLHVLRCPARVMSFKRRGGIATDACESRVAATKSKSHLITISSATMVLFRKLYVKKVFIRNKNADSTCTTKASSAGNESSTL
jgi:hypothetical protein